MAQKPGENNILVSVGSNFTKIRPHKYLSEETY